MYEDVAIATYLLVGMTVFIKYPKSLMCLSYVMQILWESERESLQLTSKQSFVDLGCGNGLLVHILSQEGVSYCIIKQLGVNFLYEIDYTLASRIWNRLEATKNMGNV